MNNVIGCLGVVLFILIAFRTRMKQTCRSWIQSESPADDESLKDIIAREKLELESGPNNDPS